jgi:hypothetical protein
MVRREFGELGVGAALARAIDPLANLGAGKLLKFVASSSDPVARIAAGHA